MSKDTLAMGAKSLAVLKEAHIPSKDGSAVVAEGGMITEYVLT